MNTEYRFSTEISALKGNTVVGKAIVYNSLSKELQTPNGSKFRELITPGAVVPSADVMALFNHNRDVLLGRMSNNTLRLIDSPDGLHVEIDLPDTSYGRDLRALMERGDVSAFSFGFHPLKQRTYQRADTKIREINQLRLTEVSVVYNPAYAAAEASLRSAEDFEFEAEKREEVAPVVEEVKKEDNTAEIQLRMHLLKGLL